MAWKWWFVALYAILLPLAIAQAIKVPTDNAIARLIVSTDPDYRDNQAFQRIFPEGEDVFLLLEARDLFEPATLARVAQIESRLGAIPRVHTFSALSLYERVRPGAPAAERAAEFRPFVTGTDLFRRAGLIGDGFLGMPLELDVHDPDERDQTLQAIDRALQPFETDRGPLQRIRRVGEPYVDAYLEAETARASLRSFPLFGAFVVVITLLLYRSWRTLVAFLTTLAVTVALSVGLGRTLGFTFTIVSTLVPLTILVTCTAALVYLQSRFIENPGGVPFEEHQAFSLANKFVATTASLFATAIGFAALAVSRIRPIREMGLWVAAGLLLTWIVVFTLFPALQGILRTPMVARRTFAGRILGRLLDALPLWSFRWRYVLLPASFLLMVAGVVALTGVPGRIAPMALETDTLSYINPDRPIARDMRRFEQAVPGVSVVQIWVRTAAGKALDPEVLRGVAAFSGLLESDRRVSSVNGPTTMLRWMQYVGGGGDRLPEETGAWPPLAARLEQELLREPELRSFVNVSSLSDLRLEVVYDGRAFTKVGDLQAFFDQAWSAGAADRPGLRDATMRVVGQGLLEEKISEYLVPTLTESFALTAAVIFLAFLVIFRSGAARLMAMVPSVFAILVMFLVMRGASIPLNVATILIASTVLGASENDQIHFFYHFHERRPGSPTEEAMRHALQIAGRAIVFATVINAAGFLALALSDLPPMRQFGIMAASAFLLSMLASLTAMPAALWIVFRERPGAVPRAAGTGAGLRT